MEVDKVIFLFELISCTLIMGFFAFIAWWLFRDDVYDWMLNMINRLVDWRDRFLDWIITALFGRDTWR